MLEKLNKENSKKIFLLGDFHIDLLQYKTSEPANNFVDTLSPLILLQIRISNSSSTLIDNIFCNVTFNSNIVSGKFLFNWDSLHARLNSNQEAWSYKRKKHKNIKRYKKSL